MVFLSQIYTKSGDAGETGLGNGQRVPKNHPRVAAYGDVDELNSLIGAALTISANQESELLWGIQNDLFDLGADLCVPQGDGEAKCLRITESQVEKLERAIDRINARLQPLNSFVLPGGSRAAAFLHLARTVCRRAERSVVGLMRDETINPQALIYLNRLSDLLFVLARAANDDGRQDVLWRPGANA